MAMAMWPSTRSALRSRGTQLSLLTAAILAWPLLASALPPAQDLAADARQMREQRLPMLVLYSREGCGWCERARVHHLDPLAADPASASRVLIRQIDVDRRTALTDFAGKPGSHKDFARARKIRLTPTIELLGPDGELLAEAIVGVRLPDFYGTYIERAIDGARDRLQEKKP
jgi:hypothetical protein